MKTESAKQLLQAADIIEQFCEFINPCFYKKTIFYGKQLAVLMRESGKGEYPPYFMAKAPLEAQLIENVRMLDKGIED